jgi:septal ring-binding cell division protein DamX
MRFEIRAGGALLFLVGLAALSGTVFALGLIAGYEMARQNQVDSSQLATNFPLPSPQAAAATPRSAPSPALAAGATTVAPPAAASVRTRSAAATRAAAQPPPGEETPEEASVPPSSPPEEEASTGSDQRAPSNPVAAVGARTPGVASTPPAKVAATEPAPLVRRHPYNIQIDAVMDNAGAQQMAARLRRLGYTPTIVPSMVAGQTWYRVKVGPFATAEEARAAQDRLRAQYDAAYGH